MEVWTSFNIKMSTEKDYEVVKTLINKFFNNVDSLMGPKYDKSNLSIIIEEVLADENDVISFADIFSDQLCKCADNQRNAETKRILESVHFIIQGNTNYAGSGENIDFIIEKKDRNLTVGTIDYCFYYEPGSFSDYEEFCDEVEDACPNVREIISEDKFDPNCEYRLSWGSKIFTSETAEYHFTTHRAGELEDIRSYWSEKLNEELIHLSADEVYSLVSEI